MAWVYWRRTLILRHNTRYVQSFYTFGLNKQRFKTISSIDVDGFLYLPNDNYELVYSMYISQFNLNHIYFFK